MLRFSVYNNKLTVEIKILPKRILARQRLKFLVHLENFKKFKKLK